MVAWTIGAFACQLDPRRHRDALPQATRHIGVLRLRAHEAANRKLGWRRRTGFGVAIDIEGVLHGHHCRLCQGRVKLCLAHHRQRQVPRASAFDAVDTNGDSLGNCFGAARSSHHKMHAR